MIKNFVALFFLINIFLTFQTTIFSSLLNMFSIAWDIEVLSKIDLNFSLLCVIYFSIFHKFYYSFFLTLITGFIAEVYFPLPDYLVILSLSFTFFISKIIQQKVYINRNSISYFFTFIIIISHNLIKLALSFLLKDNANLIHLLLLKFIPELFLGLFFYLVIYCIIKPVDKIFNAESSSLFENLS